MSSKSVIAAVNSLSQAGFQASLLAGNVKAATQHKGVKSRDLWQVPVESLRVLEGFNVRVKNKAYHDHIERLAVSMANEGYYQDKPLAGYVAKVDGEDVIYVTDGHCRLEAVQLANSRGAEIAVIPVVASASGTNFEDLTVALMQSNTGRPLTAFEQAVIAKRLIKFNWTPKEVSDRMGVSTTTVNNYLALMEAPLEIRSWVADGVLGMHKALEALRDMGEGAVPYLREALEAHAKKNDGGGAGEGGGSSNDTGNANAGGSSGGRGATRNAVIKTFSSSVKKAAPRMFDVISSLRNDQAFGSLSEETRGQINSLVEELEQLRAAKNDGEGERGNATNTGAGNDTQGKTVRKEEAAMA
ncbi:MAG: hypothetical protein E6R08_00430 [Nevskiaceae bacterium]|nr:MAG: hypothetical protein E6R08_00430 [Nevskiaceae bacterium]